MIQYDPGMANRLLDQIGMKDTDGDGSRELPNGKKLVINMQFFHTRDARTSSGNGWPKLV